MPRCRSGSSSTVWRRIHTPKCHDRLTAIVVAPTPPRTPVIAIARPPNTPSDDGACPNTKAAEMARHLVARQRFRQIVGRAETARHLAIEVGVVQFANDQHADIRLDDMRQIAQRGQRLILAADIDHQHPRCRLLLHRCDRCAYATTADIDVLADHEVGQAVAQRFLRARIGDERGQCWPVVARR